MKVASRPLLRRLAVIDGRVRDGSYPNAESLALEQEVSVRTVRRDLECMRTELNAPLEFCPKRNGYFYSRPAYQLPLLELQEGELFALFLAERVLQAYEGAAIARDLAGVFRKLAAGLSESVTLRLEHLAEACSVRMPALPRREAGLFARLVRAVEQGRQLDVRYWTANRDEELRRGIDPYHLESIHGEWYLVGFCHLRKDVRTFALARIRSMRETGRTFERPADFDAEAYFDGSFGVIRGGEKLVVRLRFREPAARYVREKEWHPSQKVRERKDGGLELTMTVTHLLELKKWVLSYGPDCEVLEPEELRREVMEDLRLALARYV